MSRYLERAEHTARLAHVHLGLRLEQPPELNRRRVHRLIASLGLEPPEIPPGRSLEAVERLCHNAKDSSSIVSCVMAARSNARQIREQISSEMWEQLNKLYHDVLAAAPASNWEDTADEFAMFAMERVHLFQGLTDSTMLHGEGWRFIQLGRFLERAINIVTLLDVHFLAYPAEGEPGASDYPEWVGLLKASTGFEAYCKVYTPSIEPERVAEFLMLNGEFPHSLRFAADRVRESLEAIGKGMPQRRAGKVQRAAGRLDAMLSFTQMDEIVAGGLHETLRDLKELCLTIHDGVYGAFIAYPIEAALEV
jgi:uncharacterized alpha-E superfamily protein